MVKRRDKSWRFADSDEIEMPDENVIVRLTRFFLILSDPFIHSRLVQFSNRMIIRALKQSVGV